MHLALPPASNFLNSLFGSLLNFLSIEINLHIKDVDILYKLKDFFGVGAVYLRANKNILTTF